jgi:RimJ/RimL family protein N-acetyltransferase
LARGSARHRAPADSLSKEQGDMDNSISRSSISVVPATEDDIPFIMSVERTLGYPALVGCYDAAEHRRRFSLPNNRYLLCVINGRSAGFAAVRRDEDGMGNVQIHRIAVATAGIGHGAAFLWEICNTTFAAPEIGRLWLDLLPSNARAKHVYLKIGFVEEGTMRAALRLPSGRREDLLLMSILREQWHESTRGTRRIGA